LLQHLQTVLTDVKQDPQAPCEVLEYFLRRLSSPQTASRAQAIKVSVRSNYTYRIRYSPDCSYSSVWCSSSCGTVENQAVGVRCQGS
jgi:hypothetical protein